MSQEQAKAAPPKPKSEVNLPKAAIAIAIGVIIAFIPAPEGLTVESMRWLGIFLGMIAALLLQVAQMWAITNFAALTCIAVKLGSFSTFYGEFAGSTIWMLLAVIAMAGVLAQSGIMKRIAFNILKFFPPNYTGQVMALAAVSLVLGPMVPSSTAKMAIIAPLAGTVAKESGMAPHSKGVVGLWFVIYMLGFVGAWFFLTGSNINLIMLGMLPADYDKNISWMGWFMRTLPAFIPCVILTVLAVSILFKPKEKMDMTKDTIKQQIADLGPMSEQEKYAGIVLAVTVGLWVTADIHHISSTIIAWIALFAFYFKGMYGSRDVGRMPWAMCLMFGPMMGVIGQMGPLGITGWVASLLPREVIQKLIPNSFVFVAILVIFITFARIAIDTLSLMPINIAIFGPVAAMLGIDMWLIVVLTWFSGLGYLLPHHGVTIMQQHGMMGGDELISYSDVTWTTWVYSAICLASCLIAVPFWSMSGLV
jgi:Di- and tricarboxylate transporters